MSQGEDCRVQAQYPALTDRFSLVDKAEILFRARDVLGKQQVGIFRRGNDDLSDSSISST
jgi:hypothetical protein